MSEQDIQYFMGEAILEGRKALPNCLPNPPVGCVIVQDGKIVARGHTNPPGKDHAEAMALRQLAGGIGIGIEGGELSLFVTLEPCSFYGRTPSCAKVIVGWQKEIKQVYVGMIDPHPKNRGAGIAILKQAGIEVFVGVLEEEIRSDLKPYLALDVS